MPPLPHPTCPPSPAIGGGAPASVPDLRAFLVDLLADLQSRYRSGAMDGWHDFWNLDSHGRPTDPKVEGACRNTLGTHLTDRLRPFDVTVDRKVQVAGQKRPDLQLRLPSCGKLPIEVKRQQHDDLWTAASDQLDRQYCRARKPRAKASTSSSGSAPRRPCRATPAASPGPERRRPCATRC